MMVAMLAAQATLYAPAINSSTDAYMPYIDCYWSHIPKEWQFISGNDVATKAMFAAIAHSCRVERALALDAAEAFMDRFPVIHAQHDARNQAEKHLFGTWFDQMLARMSGRGHAEAAQFLECVLRLGEVQMRKVV